MSLSKDLISQFVKATKDTTTVKKESTVYGTVVKYNEKTYVKIDGSDLLTPAETLSSVEEGERVSIMIKDHTATITGNYTAPSASSIKVDGMEADLKANTADIKNLVAKNAEIENLVATKATIEDLRAANAEIGTLKADYAEIENLVAGKASIGDLEAVNADIKSLKADKADIAHLEANYATIGSLNAVYADVTRLEADKANIKDLEANYATIESLEANYATINQLESNYATIKQLDAANANITNLQTETANINTALIDKADISDLNATNANITNLQATKANVSDLNATNANINTLTGNLADITTLVNGNLTSDNIQSMVITGDKFTVEDGFIKNAMIDSVNANKINAGIINTNNVSIQSNDGSMLLQGNLQQFKDKNGKVRIQIGKDATGNFTFVLYDENGTGQLINQNGIQSSNAIADGLIVDSKVADNANIAGSKLDIDSVVTEVNNGTTSIKGAKIYLDEQKQSLNVAFNNMSTTVKGNTDTIESHTTSINTMNGKVTQLISDTTITKQDGTTTSLKDAYNATVDTVDSHSTKIGSLETNLATANNNISSVSSKQSALEQNLNGFKQTVSETYTTKAEFNELSVGGTNLQRLSSPYLLREKTVADCWTAGRGLLSHNSEPTMGTDCYWLNISSTKDNSFTQLKTNYRAFKIEKGKKYSYSIDYSIGTNSAGIQLMIFNYNDSKSAELFSDRKNTAGQTYKKHKEGTWIATWTGEAYLCIYNTGFINKANGASNVLFDKIKFEEGSIPTNWDPAPQDLNDAINTVDGKFVNYSTTSQMNSAINQKANEITSTVSETYATKSALNTVDGKFADYSTTSAMNSAIQQKANEITSAVSETYATKTSVTDVSNNLKNNYSTTSAMNSAINQKANEITSAVSETYTTKTDFNNLSIGGTNLLLNSDWHKGKQSPWSINAMATIDTTNGRITLPFKSGGEVEVHQTVNIDKPNTKHTFSVYIYENNLEKGLRLYWRNYNSSTDEWSSWSYVVIPLNFTGWYAHTFTPTGSRVIIDVEAYYDTGGKAVLGCFKLEQGNKATAWSPNPADIDSAISTVDGKFINYSTTSQMNSAINQKANEITSSVSQTYATKSALTTVDNKFANYSTTSAMNSAIQQKANEITSTVSETYATKTSVTDVSNNLKNNYSTTSAMNSAIQQKANEITSSVSQTYATKTSVTDVSNNLKNNYSTTSAMNSAINQKANEITSSVSQTYATKSALNTVDGKFANYSTTSAMNSAINQKANEITSAVSETYTTKADFNNLNIGGTNLQRYSKSYLLRGKPITDIWNYSRGIMKVEYEASFGENVYWLTYDSAKDSIDAGTSWANLHDSYNKIKVTKDKVYTISLDILRGRNCKGFRVALWDCTSGDKFIVNLFYKGTDLKDNVVTHLSKQWTSTITGYIYICIYNLGEIASSSVSGTSNLLFTNIKFEEGNKETTWNPNPLDINDNITTVDNKFVNYSTTSQMNSAINQKANEITSTVSETYATKTSVTDVSNNLKNNYSTTSAMNSAINQKANEITSAVSETYTTKTDFNNLSIGGTNLQRYSKAYLLKGASPSNYWNISSNSTLTTISYNDMYNKELVYKLTLPHTATTYAWAELNATCRKMYIENGKKYTLSLDYTTGDNCKGILINLYKGSDNSFLVTLYQENKSTVGGGGNVKRKEIVWTSTYTGDVHICIFNLGAISKDNGDSNLLFTNLKFEQGNKATAWSPSPADVDASITAVDSKFANYSTTTQMNSAIDQKANEITSSVSSTYATKTALNTVDGKFANYSTTSQMNSAIAQKGDAILSTVSNTYTTKTDFNGLSVGGTNLQRFSSSYLLKDKSITNYWTAGRGNLTHASDGSMGGDCYWLAVSSGKIDCYTQLFSAYGHFDIKQGEKYSYSIDYSLGTNCAGIRVQLFNNGDTKNYLLFEDTKNVAGQTNKIHKEGTWTATWTGKAYVCIYNLGFINTANGASNLLFNNIKIEKGTFPTSWSPAPQDVNANIDFISENLSANYSTTSEMNTAINQKAESITQSVSSTYATKTSLKSANDNITSLTNRMQSAESKLTKDSLTTTIGKYYTTSTDVDGIITNKGYATTSQVNQTATDLTAKFSSAGGYNMVRNGGFIKDTSNWTDLGGGIARNSSINTRTGWYVDTVLPKGFCGEWFRIFNGKYYTFSARIWVAGTDLKMTYCTPLDWITNGTGSGGHQGGYIGEYTFSHTTIPKGQWVDIWLTFKCTANGYFKPYIKSESASDTMSISIADIMITEGKVVLPWSPHPYEVYDGITQINKDGIKVYHNNINGENYTHMSPTGFYIKNKGTDIFKVDGNGLYIKGNGEFTGTISASNINGSTINGTSINSDSFVGDVLAIDGTISAKSLQVQDIDSAKYPATLDGNVDLYVNSSSGNDDIEADDGARFKTLQGAIDAIPKFLNNKTVYITMETNSTEDVSMRGIVGGAIRIYMNGKTLYGTLRSYVCAASINVYGGTRSSSEGATSVIHPSVGISFGGRAVSVGFEASQYAAIYKVKVFAPDSLPSDVTNTDKVCIASQSGTGSVYCKNIQIVNAAIGFRANNLGGMHVNSSSGVASKYGFQAATGGIITIANNNQAGGKTSSTNKSGGGQVLYDTNGPTFATGNQSTDGGTAPVAPTTKVLTVKSSYGDTYRSSVYKNWKKDGTVRQGDYGYGDCNGCWFFGSAFAEVKGATIKKVTITITRQSGGSSSAVGLVVKSHGHSSRPSGAPTFRTTAGTLSLAAGKSAPLVITNSTILNEIKSGVVKGFGIQATYDSSHYAVCSGSVTVKIEYQE